MGSAGLGGSEFKVHVSFSDADEEFVDKIIEGLEHFGRFKISVTPGPSLDQEGWEPRHSALISVADTVVYVLSPDSAQSEICAWEVEHAHELSKRILPVLCRQLDNISVPGQLTASKPVRFDKPRSFEQGLRTLVALLDANVEWIRKHTQLYVRAREWEDAGQSADRLLTGAEIIAAKAWTFERPSDAPLPTELHITFIGASEAIDVAGRNAGLKPQKEQVALNAPEQVQTKKKRPRAKPLYAAITGTLVILAIAAGWQALEVGKQATGTGRDDMALRHLTNESTRRLFAAQQERIEKSLKTVECLLLQHSEEGNNCLGDGV